MSQIASFGREALGLDYSSAALLIIVLNGVALPFRIMPAMIADRVGIINVIVVVAWAWSIVAFSWLGVSKVGGYYVFTVFYGITSGSFQSMIPTAVTGITKRLDMVGTRLGSEWPIQPLMHIDNQTLGILVFFL